MKSPRYANRISVWIVYL